MKYKEILDLLSSTSGLKFDGTIPNNVRFYDDKTTYTGVHKFGGPEVNDSYGRTSNPNPHIELKDMLNRSECDVRGINKNVKK